MYTSPAISSLSISLTELTRWEYSQRCRPFTNTLNFLLPQRMEIWETELDSVQSRVKSRCESQFCMQQEHKNQIFPKTQEPLTSKYSPSLKGLKSRSVSSQPQSPSIRLFLTTVSSCTLGLKWKAMSRDLLTTKLMLNLQCREGLL